tara:strand:- start:247 stop:528 length:282 start_codon:yes stop_codon:yes gene_type:complete
MLKLKLEKILILKIKFLNFTSKVLQFLLLFLINIYKIVLSPLFGRQCRFDPTCSSYSKQAIIKYGSLKGIFLTVKRILRCNPWSKSDYIDPVP